MLSEREIESYTNQGFLQLREVFTQEEVVALATELLRICRFEYGPVAGAAQPRPEDSDDALLRRCVAIHFPHKLSRKVHDTALHPTLVGLWTSLLGPNVKCVQSMFFVRPSGGPGQAWHQDEFYIPSRDRSVTSAWIALDRATPENGCLRVIPGSHKRGIIWPHGPHADPRYDPVDSARHPYDERDAVVLSAEPGDVIAFSGHLLHSAGPNSAASGFRRALAFHAMRAESRVPWMGAELRGPVGGADCRDFVLVAGEDPYASAPMEDVCKPWMRPAKV